MPDNPITVPLPQDLPTNWTYGQTIGAAGTDVGLTQQHGYNYLMQQVNAAQQAAQEIGTAFENLTAENVDAAPNGYGLGYNTGFAPEQYGGDLNNIKTNCWYVAAENTENCPPSIPLSAYGYGIVLSRVGAAFTQVHVHSNYIAIRQFSGGNWGPWIYVNPPMQAGIEYLTAEHWNGKPVYAKLVNFGALPNATTSTLAHGISNIANIIFASGSASNGQSLPCTNFGGSANDSVAISADTTNIYVTTTQNLSTLTASILLKYTKTTD